MEPKSLRNTDANGTTKNVPDVVFFGNGDTFELICKAYSQEQGWMKSTKAMEIPGLGAVVQVSTQQCNPDGSYSLAEAVTFVPGVMIARREENGVVVGRTLTTNYEALIGAVKTAAEKLEV